MGAAVKMDDSWKETLETWKETLWTTWSSSRVQMLELYAHSASTLSVASGDLEGFIRNNCVGRIQKNVGSLRERRKLDAKGLQGKLKQMTTRLQLGILILTFAVVGTLAFPLMFADLLPGRQTEPKFGAVVSSHLQSERDETFNRKYNFAEERKLIHEEQKKAVQTPDDEIKNTLGTIDIEENREETIGSGVANLVVEINEERLPGSNTLPAPSGRPRKPGKPKLRNSTRLKRGSRWGNNMAVNKESELVEENAESRVSDAGENSSGTAFIKERNYTLADTRTSVPNEVELRSFGVHDEAMEDSTLSSAIEQTHELGKLKSEFVERNDTPSSRAFRFAENMEKIAHSGDNSAGLPEEAESIEDLITSNVGDAISGDSHNNPGQWERESSDLDVQEAENYLTDLDAGSLERTDELSEEVPSMGRDFEITTDKPHHELNDSHPELVTAGEGGLSEVNKSTGPTAKSVELVDKATEVSKRDVSTENDDKAGGVLIPDENTSVVLALEQHKVDESVFEGNVPALDKNFARLVEKNLPQEDGTREEGSPLENREKLARPSISEETKESQSISGNITDPTIIAHNESTSAPLQKVVASGIIEGNQWAVDNETLKTYKKGSNTSLDVDNRALGSKEEDVVKAVGVTPNENPESGVMVERNRQTEVQKENNDVWLDEFVLIPPLRQTTASGTLKVGLLNMEETDLQRWDFLVGETPLIFPFERVSETLEWNQLYPEWIDEEERYGPAKCPSVPMPDVNTGVQLDAVIVRAPCTTSPSRDGWRNPAYLQVLLGAASLAVKTGNRSIFVLVLSECRPLVNLFTCGDLLDHRNQGWLYKVDLEQMRKRLSLPVGSCQLSVPLQGFSHEVGASNPQKEAYATILHSGPDYVCGAIVAAHSIRRTGSTRDLVILVDGSILSEHRQGLVEAGWKVQDLELMRTANAVGAKDSGNDFSKLRLWQLTNYSKVIYIDADLLVLRNLDILFSLPEVSASGSIKTMYNSGVMVIEPSICMFNFLKDEMQEMQSENGVDQDLLNQVFPLWHRIPRQMNYLKYFWTNETKEVQYMNRLFSAEPAELHAIHYWGLKPWQCYKEYDCNWNFDRRYASNEAHAQWFKMHDGMPGNLQKHCSLSTARKAILENNRQASEVAGSVGRH